MSRRVITGAVISELAAQGAGCLQLEPGDIVTALARDDAASRGITIVPVGEPGPAEPAAPAAAAQADNPGVQPTESAGGFATAGGPPSCVRVVDKAPAETPQDDAISRDQVRRAVIGVLGHEPDGLDAVIAKVMS